MLSNCSLWLISLWQLWLVLWNKVKLCTIVRGKMWDDELPQLKQVWVISCSRCRCQLQPQLYPVNGGVSSDHVPHVHQDWDSRADKAVLCLHLLVKKILYCLWTSLDVSANNYYARYEWVARIVSCYILHFIVTCHVLNNRLGKDSEWNNTPYSITSIFYSTICML